MSASQPNFHQDQDQGQDGDVPVFALDVLQADMQAIDQWLKQEPDEEEYSALMPAVVVSEEDYDWPAMLAQHLVAPPPGQPDIIGSTVPLLDTPPSSPSGRSRQARASSRNSARQQRSLPSSHPRTETPPPNARLREGTPPRRAVFFRPSSTSPPPRHCAQVEMPLHLALRDRDLRAVRAALKEDPEAAKEFVMDDACQPMVCYAAEHRCCSEILLELARRGADFNAVNARGLVPLRIIAEWIPTLWQGDLNGYLTHAARAEMETLAVRAAKVALTFGARPQVCGPDGMSAIDVAASRGATCLEDLLAAACAAETCTVLYTEAFKSELKGRHGMNSLPGAALRAIGEHLIPASHVHAVLGSIATLVQKSS